MDGDEATSELASLVRHTYESRLAGLAAEESPRAAGEVLLRAVAAERRRLVELRDDGTIGDDAFHRIEEDLDWAELNAGGRE
jgi:monovalent cation/hydrogen antiporter